MEIHTLVISYIGFDSDSFKNFIFTFNSEKELLIFSAKKLMLFQPKTYYKSELINFQDKLSNFLEIVHDHTYDTFLHFVNDCIYHRLVIVEETKHLKIDITINDKLSLIFDISSKKPISFDLSPLKINLVPFYKFYTKLNNGSKILVGNGFYNFFVRFNYNEWALLDYDIKNNVFYITDEPNQYITTYDKISEVLLEDVSIEKINEIFNRTKLDSVWEDFFHGKFKRFDFSNSVKIKDLELEFFKRSLPAIHKSLKDLDGIIYTKADPLSIDNPEDDSKYDNFA